MSKTRVVIHGAAGRMGQRLVALTAADPHLILAGALDRADHPELGNDAGAIARIGNLGIPLRGTLDELSAVDVVIDFSSPAGASAITGACRQRRIPLVMATTGLEPDQESLIREAAESIPIVWAPSMSLAVNLTMKLAALAAAGLKEYPGGADVEIIERHHRFKEDAPSGTALRFGQIVSQELGLTEVRHGRHGRPGARPHQELAYHAVRVGDNPGEHTILFGMLGESIELTVRASNRDAYAYGALAAARFVAQRPPGLYQMADVLGL